jgi:hypothetical protein
VGASRDGDGRGKDRRERVRLERLGVIDASGNLVSNEVPAEMRPESDTTVETG